MMLERVDFMVVEKGGSPIKYPYYESQGRYYE